MEEFALRAIKGECDIKVDPVPVREWYKKSTAVSTEYFVKTFTGVLPSMLHHVGCHDKIVDSVLTGMGMTKDDLPDPTYYKMLCETIKVLFTLVKSVS